jgi:hypothetical protein
MDSNAGFCVRILKSSISVLSLCLPLNLCAQRLIGTWHQLLGSMRCTGYLFTAKASTSRVHTSGLGSAGTVKSVQKVWAIYLAEFAKLNKLN